jgi:hypothetical protein
MEGGAEVEVTGRKGHMAGGEDLGPVYSCHVQIGGPLE